MKRAGLAQRAAAVLMASAILLTPAVYGGSVQAASPAITHVLKQGSRGDEVSKVQQRLKELGFFNAGVTGYYGSITKDSVIKFQKSVGLKADGVVGSWTAGALFKTASNVSRGDVDREDLLIPWFGGVENIFSRGTQAVVTDVATGISFKVQRTGGHNHSDTETLTPKDTALLLKIADGEWNWTRRAVIVTIGSKKIAGSMTSVPHAGLDNKPALQYVSGRSGGYGSGTNYDSVKGNNMDGHFDIHFLGSRTHGTNRVDEQHQAMIHNAAENYAQNN